MRSALQHDIIGKMECYKFNLKKRKKDEHDSFCDLYFGVIGKIHEWNNEIKN